ncbi:MAG: D-tyrosyl-tRNA(Tyr) deacylase [bacterium]|jgi:D-tyrosyl-tRNA(Tyr) deacylase
MRIVLQRVSQAQVEVDEAVVGKIQQGYLLLIGFEKEDHEELLKPMAQKVLKLKLFSNEQGRFHHNLSDVNGEILAISQFTLFAELKKGTKPSLH